MLKINSVYRDGSHRDNFGKSLRDFARCRVTVVVSFLRLVITLNKTLVKHIQSNQKSTGKSIQPIMDFKNLKKKILEPKVSKLCQMFVISKQKSLENLEPILSIFIPSQGLSRTPYPYSY